MRIGLIGTGTMGKPMAHHLLEAGYSLTIFARQPSKMADLKDKGASIPNSPAEVGVQSDCLILSLLFDPEVAEVILGEKGIAQKASSGTIITTTGTPRAAMELTTRLAEQGIEYLDAPVSGEVKGALDAKLTFMVGGKKEAFEKVKPLMKILGSNIYHLSFWPCRNGASH